MLSAVCLCADKRILLSLLEICMDQGITCFLVILWNLLFSGVSDFEADLLYLLC